MRLLSQYTQFISLKPKRHKHDSNHGLTEQCQKNGEIWVVESSGGISTFAAQGLGKNWWKLDGGCTIPDELCLVNDYGNHWAWEPGYTMKLDDYKSALQSVAERFYKVS
jgi:hypothetical protein